MLALTEIEAMEAALRAHDGFIAALRREYDNTSRLDVFSDTRERAKTILDENIANHARFVERRNELIEMEPSDHEAVIAFVSGVRKISGSSLPAQIRRENEANATTTIVGGALVETGKDIANVLKFGLPMLAIVALAYLVFTMKGKA